jgi:parvulin-like peptidyl-prolyl isomerase
MDQLIRVGDWTLDGPTLMDTLGRAGLLPNLLQAVLVEQAIAPITLTPDEAEQAEADFCQRQQLTSAEQRQTWAAQQCIDPQAIEILALRDAKLRKFKRLTFEQQVESYFLQRKKTLDKVKYSLLRTRDLGLAQELYFRIHDDGIPFAELASVYAEGQEAETGGLIGPVELSVPNPQLAQLLAISQPGQLWPPKKIGDWFVVVRLEKFIPAQLDEVTRQRLVNELFSRWLHDQMQTVPTEGLPCTPATEIQHFSV